MRVKYSKYIERSRVEQYSHLIPTIGSV